MAAGSFAVKLIVQLSPTVTQGRGALGLDGNNNQQLVRKTESGGLPLLLLLLLLLSGKIHFTLLSLQEEGSEAILEHCGALNGQVKTE